MMNVRGQFRDMSMAALAAAANNPIFDDEVSTLYYRIPLSLDTDCSVISSPQSHIACFKHALDYLVPDGTPVLAMQDGVVIEVVESSAKWGNSPKFRNYLNYITIQHSDGEYSQYCHLLKHSAKDAGVKIGSEVRKGQKIGIVGRTGWTDQDHLHIAVFRKLTASPFGFKSLKISFDKRSLQHTT